MEIKYQNSIENINWSSVSELMNKVGWGSRKPQELEKAFKTSSYTKFAFHNNKLVGFGRTVDDGKYYALIVDLVVSPDYQGKGIGAQMLSELKDSLSNYVFTTLTAAPGKELFYSSQNWEVHKTAFIWPRSEEQRQNHAKGR